MDILTSSVNSFLLECCKCTFSGKITTLIHLSDVTEPNQLVDIANWMRFSRIYLSDAKLFYDALKEINKALAHRSFLVGDSLSLADLVVWCRLQSSKEWFDMHKEVDRPEPIKPREFCYLNRLYRYLNEQKHLSELADQLSKGRFSLSSSMNKCKLKTELVKPAMADNPLKSTKISAKDMMFEEGGKFEELVGAKMGEVVVRFPPEASGYMHIGHAKAALLNQHYKDTFNGKIILRFDDTNPTKETVEYEHAIMSDLPRLGFKWDTLTYTSNYFDLMIEFCTQMIKQGKAYADNTDAEKMKSEREQRIESACRINSVEVNLKWWDEMQKGSDVGKLWCIRAKIDMSSDNGALRDPTIYRCKDTPHIRYGTKYKVYPIYDFACPIVDSVEGVTHALRTSEYNDRNSQYYWICDALGIRKPTLMDYSRLCLQNTILSKRKLTWFVDEKLVTGWDDPRMPTVQGILRHGLTPEGLRQFVLAQGSSRSVAVMEWDKIWSFNKKIIDPIAPRYTALRIDTDKPIVIDSVDQLPQSFVPVYVSGQTTAQTKETPLHPKNPAIGMKTIVLAPTIFVESDDAECFIEGENVTFINWGNLKIRKLHRSTEPGHAVLKVDVDLNIQDMDYKKTQKVTWLADPVQAKHLPTSLTKLTPLSCITYGNLISKPVLGKDEDFKQFINKNSLTENCMLGDPQLQSLKKGDIIQLQRKGFYICDKPYNPAHKSTGKESPCLLFFIPDGATKARPSAGSKFKAVEDVKSATTVNKQQKTVANITPEESAKMAEKERQKEEKKLARKEAREKAKLTQPIACLEITESLHTSPVNPVLPSTEPQPSDQNHSSTNQKTVANTKPEESAKLAEKERQKEEKKLARKEAREKAKLTQPIACLEITESLHTSPVLPSTEPQPSDPNHSSTNQIKKKTLKKEAVTDKKTRKDVPLKDKPAMSVSCDIPESPIIPVGNISPLVDSSTNVVSTKPEPKVPKCKTIKARKDPNLATGDVLTNNNKKQTRLGLEVKKEEDTSEWYTQVIIKSEMLEYYDVSGCYILRPWSYYIWSKIQAFVDEAICSYGVENCYFPMFVSKAALEKEKAHITDFAPEVAWVTKSGDTDMSEPIAIRPTSETIMYPAFAKWIQSHRDLPVRLNQWSNIVRWEFKHPTPFLRTREFLWQEGHSAFATKLEAEAEVLQILNLYSEVYEKLLAVPCIKGRKTEREKFPGGDYTTTVEVFVAASGRSIQGATSHHLGQNFSRIFDIIFDDPLTKQPAHVFQNSWGITTRTIGVMIMVHADNKGLVLPPQVAKYQIVIVPCGITAKTTDEARELLHTKARDLHTRLSSQTKMRVHLDDRDHVSPGWKFNHWELKGVPLRVEIGFKDIAANQVTVVVRFSGERIVFKEKELETRLPALLHDVHSIMLSRAMEQQKNHIATATSVESLASALDKKCFVLAPFCEAAECEDQIRLESAKAVIVTPGMPSMGAKSLCIPFEGQLPGMKTGPISDGSACIRYPLCKSSAKSYVLFGRSY